MKFVKHKPVDKSDLPFRIPGKQLRWLSAQVSETSPGRIWCVIRKSELPPDLVKHIETTSVDPFRGGDTIRRGDLVLGYASEEAVKELKMEVREKNVDQESKVKAGATVRREHGVYSKVEVNEDSDATQEMIERFKTGKDN